VRLAYLQHWARDRFQARLGIPLEKKLFRLWLENRPGAGRLEALGLPRRAVQDALGEQALTLHVDPRKLIRLAVHGRGKGHRRPSSMIFIGDGDWDLRREDLRVGTRYRLITELDENRSSLADTERYQELMACIRSGEPWASHQEGILLDTPAKILRYLRIYVGFLDDMAVNGFDPERGKDPIGVAISREGRILKINRGLHRLAMAQRIGLPSIPVRVQCVHRLWWRQVAGEARGEEALQRVRMALAQCVPEEDPGPLDTDPAAQLPDDFWPAPRYCLSSNPS